ncbi:MAG: CPBP family intramembrane metalloprotease [Ktedonobacteraceae bacterium]|nr:CPBP family intramembrane metalloprotease [Ktedonobacteraceae bacterium]
MAEQKLREQVPWTMQQTFLGILFTLVPWLILSFWLAFASGSPPGKPLPPEVDLANALVLFVFGSLIEGTFLIAPLVFARRAYRPVQERRLRWRRAWQALGFRRSHLWRAVLLVVAGFLLITAINFLYGYLITLLHQYFPSINIQTNDQRVLQEGKLAPLSTYALLLAAVLVAPFCEEMFFRGFVFMGLLRGMSLVWAGVFSALIFAVAHADPGSFPVLFIIGLVLAYLRWRSGSIWPAIVLHLLNNGLSALIIMLTLHGIL